MTFNYIFARVVESFCIKCCTFIGSLYPHMSTYFRLFILTFNEIALILLRAPIILRCQVSIVQQSVYSAKMQRTSLTEMIFCFHQMFNVL